MHKKICALLLCCLLLLVGCGQTGEVKQKTDTVNENIAVNENIINEIIDRGYLVVGCKMDVPDLSFYESKTDTWSGLEVEIAYKVAAGIFDVTLEEVKEKNLVQFVGVTVANREETLASGDIDVMLATYTITEERKQQFAFSESYYTDYIGMMVRDSGEDNNSLGSADIESVADLDGKYIGVPRNATTREAFLNYIDTMNTVKMNPIFCEYESYDVLFQALKDGNIDVMAVDVSILNGYVDASTKILSARFGGQRYGAAVCKENTPILDYVNRAIDN